MQICLSFICAYDFSMVRKVFTAKYADSSSKVGNDFDFIGATLVFANMNCDILFGTP